MIAPESFELDDVDGHACAVTGNVPDAHRERVIEAVHSCPEQAITVDHMPAKQAALGRQER
jgi:ferredoxin